MSRRFEKRSLLRERGRHDLRKEDDYISDPRTSGYRSHHLMLNYRGRGDAKVYDDRRVEVQIRTRLQHSWATAVEAVKAAYPNYFGDVQLFKLQLKNIVQGKGAKEYFLKPQEGVMPRPRENPDITWLKRRGHVRWG